MQPHLLSQAVDIQGLAARLPPATDYQQSAGRLLWLLQRSQEVRLSYVEEDGTPVAWAALEKTPEGWAMWKGPAGPRPSAELLALLLKPLQGMGTCMLVMDPAWHFPDALRLAGWQRASVYRTLLVDLAADVDLLAGMNDATRRRIRHARREGVVVVCDDPGLLDAFYPVYGDCMERACSPDFASREELASLLRSGDLHLFTAWHQGAVVAGSVCNRNSNSLEARYVATSFEHRSLGGLNLVHHAAMEWARRRALGLFDLSGIAVESDSGKLDNINRFKLGFGGATLDYAIYRASA
jgi:Acetyltransferase (GNAT) domain